MTTDGDIGSHLPRRRSPSEILKRGYSDEEIAHLYELGRFWLENGEISRALVIFTGVTEIAPDFAPGWLGVAYVHCSNRDYDGAVNAARQCLRVESNSVEAMLFLVTCLMTLGDMNAAGTYLGEIGEMIDGGLVDNPQAIRLYQMQLARYQVGGAAS